MGTTQVKSLVAVLILSFLSACAGSQEEMKTDGSYTAATTTLHPYVFHESTNLNDWNFIGENDEVKTYREKQPDSQTFAYRGEAVLPFSMDRIAWVIGQANLRNEWQDSVVSSKVIEVINDHERIEYVHQTAAWPFRDRDFVVHVNVKWGSDHKDQLLTLSSVEDDRVPVYPGIVRGQILRSYYYLKEIASGAHPSTKVVVEIAVDQKGAIHPWLGNLTQKKWPYKTLKGLKETASRLDLREPATQVRN